MLIVNSIKYHMLFVDWESSGSAAAPWFCPRKPCRSLETGERSGDTSFTSACFPLSFVTSTEMLLRVGVVWPGLLDEGEAYSGSVEAAAAAAAEAAPLFDDSANDDVMRICSC